MKTAAPGRPTMPNGHADSPGVCPLQQRERWARQLNRGIWRIAALQVFCGAILIAVGGWALTHVADAPALSPKQQWASAAAFVLAMSVSLCLLFRALVRTTLGAPVPNADSSALQGAALDRLEQALTIAQLGAWELDPATQSSWYSRQVYQMLGRLPPIDGHPAHGLDALLAPSDPDTQARILGVLQQAREDTAVALEILVPVVRTDGQARTLHLRVASMRDGGAGSVRGTLQDVTEYEKSRLLLREREEQFRELVRVLPDGVFILHQECVVYANAACAGQFGRGVHCFVGEPFQGLVFEDDLDRVRDLMLHPDQYGEAGTTARMRRFDGALFQAGLCFGEVRYGGRDCKLLLVRDLSEPERMRDALALRNDELHAMTRRLFSLQEDERRAISRDLHDDIGQAITAMKLSAHAALEEADAQRRRDDLQEIVMLADTSITKLRNLSMLLRPPQLDALGLEAALRWQAGMLFRASDVRLRMEIQALPHRPSGEIEQACFRIAQEGLTNALRHAYAGEVLLELKDDAGRLRLVIADDGDGFDLAGPRGLGLIVMRERAQSAEGELKIDSSPGAGTRITLFLPYASSAASTEIVEH